MKDAYFIDTCDSVLVTRKNAASMAILKRSLTTCSVKLDRYRVLVLKYSVTRTRSEHNSKEIKLHVYISYKYWQQCSLRVKLQCELTQQ